MNKTLIRKYYQMGIYKEKHLDIFVKADISQRTRKKKLWRVNLWIRFLIGQVR